MTTTNRTGRRSMDRASARGVFRLGQSGRRRAGIAVGLVMLAGGLAACGSSVAATRAQPDCASGAPKITVEATGQASAAPDILTVNIGVSVSGSTASATLTDANQQAKTLTNSFKFFGVAPSDVQSTDFSISPTYSQGGAITGYQVTNTLLVTLHNLSKAGQVIDAAAASVGNAIRINGLTFAVSNTGNVDGKARANAVSTAAAHARVMAAAGGESLGGICSINDSTTGPSPVSSEALQFNTAGTAAGSSVPLEAGTQQASAQVTVVYVLDKK